MNNLVLITSVINPPNTPLSYINIRTVYTKKERFEQIKKTILSVKDKIQNPYIVLIECSEEIEDYTEYLTKNTDVYINYITNDNVKNAVYSLYKGYGEAIQLLTYLSNTNLTEFKNIFKISGRYWLNDNFNYNMFDNEHNIFKYLDSNVSTRLYKIHKIYFTKYIESLTKCLNLLLKNNSIEELITKYLEFTNIKTLGVSGYIAIKKNEFIEE